MNKYSLPQLEILSSTKQINLFLAGVGSGKTHLDGVISYNFIYNFPLIKGFIGANTYDQLNTSTIFRIRDVWKSMGIVEYEENTKTGFYVVNKQPPNGWNKTNHNYISYNNIISFINGAVIYIGSLDNAKAHEGKEFGWAILDETKDTKEDDVKDIILARLRQKGMLDKNGNEWNPLYITTSPAKTDWINKWFDLDKYIKEIYDCIYSETDYFKKSTQTKLCIISSTYHNKENLPQNYIENKKQDWSNEKFKTLIYANPFSISGNEYYSSFDRINNVGKCFYNKDLPLHISFDFNVVPYNSCSIWQIEKKEEIYIVACIDEIALINPNNSTPEVCECFINRYINHTSGLYIYGDASGRARKTTNKDFKHDIAVIEYYLRKYFNNNSNRIPTSNPPNRKRREFINKCFENKLNIRIIINESCKNMIDDLTYTKQDSITGGKDKHRVKDLNTGDYYEKYGHFGDNMEYFICEAFKGYFNR